MAERLEPNPGSDEAKAAGCRCPRSDNGYGVGIPWPRTDGRSPDECPSFWTNPDCPLHGDEAEKAGRWFP